MTDSNPLFGVARPERIAGLNGREILQAIVDGRLPQVPIGQTLSFRLVEVGDGFAAFEGEPGPHLLNPMEGVHGGYSLLPPDTPWTTLETKGNFSRPITPQTGRVRCEARVVAQGKRIISAESWVRDTQGRVLAHGTSTLMVLTG